MVHGLAKVEYGQLLSTHVSVVCHPHQLFKNDHIKDINNKDFERQTCVDKIHKKQ